jgi:hypothetical protein
LDAATFRIVLIAGAIRPCLPMTFPTSDLARVMPRELHLLILSSVAQREPHKQLMITG